MRKEDTALETAGVLSLTRHFEVRLRERLGIDLTLEAVNRLLRDSKRIRRQRRVYRLINGEFQPVIELAEFWHHGSGCIMIVDEWRAKAITIVTPKDRLPSIAGRQTDLPMGTKTHVNPGAETRRAIRRGKEQARRYR